MKLYFQIIKINLFTLIEVIIISKISAIVYKILDKQSEALDDFVKTIEIDNYFADAYFERGKINLNLAKFYNEINK